VVCLKRLGRAAGHEKYWQPTRRVALIARPPAGDLQGYYGVVPSGIDHLSLEGRQRPFCGI